MKRESAVILHTVDKWYAVRYREYRWYWPFSSWRDVRSTEGHTAWDYTNARKIADQCIENGAIPGGRYYDPCVYPIIELDAE